MGYTHYIDDIKATKELAEASKRIVEVAEKDGIKVYGEYDEEPRIDEHCISVRGNCEDLTIVDDELAKKTRSKWAKYHSFNFTKTNRQPYDAVVCAILIAAMVQGQNGFASDGTLHDWINLGGVRLYEKAIAPLTNKQAQELANILQQDKRYNDTVPMSLVAYERCSPAVKKVALASFSSPVISNGNIIESDDVA